MWHTRDVQAICIFTQSDPWVCLMMILRFLTKKSGPVQKCTYTAP